MPDDRRPFTAEKDDKSTINLTIRKPTQRELEAADFALSGSFNKALRAGIAPRSMMLKQLRSSGLWGAQQEKDLEDLRQKAIEAENAFEKAEAAAKESGTPTEAELKETLTSTRNETRAAFNSALADIESMLAHTAESKADVAQRNFLMACTVELADGKNKGKRLWESVEAFDNELDGSLLNRCFYEYMMITNDRPSDWDTFSGKKKPETEVKTDDPAQAKPEPAATAAVSQTEGAEVVAKA